MVVDFISVCAHVIRTYHYSCQWIKVRCCCCWYLGSFELEQAATFDADAEICSFVCRRETLLRNGFLVRRCFVSSASENCVIDLEPDGVWRA